MAGEEILVDAGILKLSSDCSDGLPKVGANSWNSVGALPDAADRGVKRLLRALGSAMQMLFWPEMKLTRGETG